MPELKMLVHSTDMDMISGHYTITASIEEHADDGTVVTSPMETFGISHDELQLKYESNPEKWRDTLVAETLKRHHYLRQQINTSLVGWMGRRFPVL
jgi:hypothetical protein